MTFALFVEKQSPFALSAQSHELHDKIYPSGAKKLKLVIVGLAG
jgi:hypothetical protein